MPQGWIKSLGTKPEMPGRAASQDMERQTGTQKGQKCHQPWAGKEKSQESFKFLDLGYIFKTVVLTRELFLKTADVSFHIQNGQRSFSDTGTSIFSTHTKQPAFLFHFAQIYTAQLGHGVLGSCCSVALFAARYISTMPGGRWFSHSSKNWVFWKCHPIKVQSISSCKILYPFHSST